MQKVVGDITNLHYNFVVVRPLVTYNITSIFISIFPILAKLKTISYDKNEIPFTNIIPLALELH